jgi:SAM-dependent methyltransferase
MTTACFGHNDFYHRFLLRQVPPGCRRALDVGCGTGSFARRLARRARVVEGVDRAPEVIAAARALSRDVPNLEYTEVDLADHDLGCHDYISCIASVHHMPFAETVARLRDALAPGGVLAILGCYRQVTPADHLPDLVAIPGNLVANAVVRGIGRRRASPHTAAPVLPPGSTLAEIKRDARHLLPGAVVRRRVYWRYSLVYQHL